MVCKEPMTWPNYPPMSGCALPWCGCEIPTVDVQCTFCDTTKPFEWYPFGTPVWTCDACLLEKFPTS